MDEATRRRMVTGHLNHREICACGKELLGNGRKSHLRVCVESLLTRGWPLSEGMAEVIRHEVNGAPGVVTAVERRLGQFYAGRRQAGNTAPLPWPEFRDLVWQYVDETTRTGDRLAAGERPQTLNTQAELSVPAVRIARHAPHSRPVRSPEPRDKHLPRPRAGAPPPDGRS